MESVNVETAMSYYKTIARLKLIKKILISLQFNKIAPKIDL